MGIFNIKTALLVSQPADQDILKNLNRSTEPVTFQIRYLPKRPWTILLGFEPASRLHTLAICARPDKPTVIVVFDPRTGRVGLLPKSFELSRAHDMARIGSLVTWTADGPTMRNLLRNRNYGKIRPASPAELVLRMMEHMGEGVAESQQPQALAATA